MIRVTFDALRDPASDLGPLVLVVQEVTCTLWLERRAPACGVRVELELETLEPTTSDADQAARALDVALTAANRALQVAAYVGEKRGIVPTLEQRDLIDPQCLDLAREERRLELPQFAPRRPRLRPVARERVQAMITRLDETHAAGFQRLWLEALEAHYNQRYREAIVLARAAIEVAWEVVATGTAEAHRGLVTAPARPSVFVDLVERSLERSLSERLSTYCHSLFGYSFASDVEPSWDQDAWSQLNKAFSDRHLAVHQGKTPAPDESWSAITLCRRVLDRLEQLRHEAAPSAAGFAKE